jgi:ABC-type sugar transport system ATPase subunit
MIATLLDDPTAEISEKELENLAGLIQRARKKGR